VRTLSLSLLEPSASFPLEMLSQQLRSRPRPSSSSSLRALQRHKRLYATLHEDAPSTHPTEKGREPEDGPKEVGPSLDPAASASEVAGVASVDSTVRSFFISPSFRLITDKTGCRCWPSLDFGRPPSLCRLSRSLRQRHQGSRPPPTSRV
jgi:hypothetical protein